MNDETTDSPNSSLTSWLREQVLPLIVFLAVIWVCFGVSIIVPSMNDFGVAPRSLWGLVGIFTMPFLHSDWRHLASNTPPLLVLMGLMVVSRARPWSTIILLTIFTGAALWLVGRSTDGANRYVHIGASGLVYALMGFMIVAGVMERKVLSAIVALGVGVIYGGAILGGMLPTPGVSWEGHLCGLIVGSALAWSRFRVEKKPVS